MAEWWKGKALGQATHERINAQHYPGTRQLCVECAEPTGRCEDDSVHIEDHGPLCEACYDLEFERQKQHWQPLYEGEKIAGFLPNKDS